MRNLREHRRQPDARRANRTNPPRSNARANLDANVGWGHSMHETTAPTWLHPANPTDSPARTAETIPG